MVICFTFGGKSGRVGLNWGTVCFLHGALLRDFLGSFWSYVILTLSADFRISPLRYYTVVMSGFSFWCLLWHNSDWWHAIFLFIFLTYFDFVLFILNHICQSFVFVFALFHLDLPHKFSSIVLFSAFNLLHSFSSLGLFCLCVSSILNWKLTSFIFILSCDLACYLWL